MEKIGVIGFGVMGKAIANSLERSGYEVLVYDKSNSEASNAQIMGYIPCMSPGEIALKSKIISKDWYPKK